MIYFIYHSHSFLSREHMNPQLTCSQRQWLHSSVGRASHEFFSGFFTQLHKLRSLRRSFLHFHCPVCWLQGLKKQIYAKYYPLNLSSDHQPISLKLHYFSEDSNLLYASLSPREGIRFCFPRRIRTPDVILLMVLKYSVALIIRD